MIAPSLLDQVENGISPRLKKNMELIQSPVTELAPKFKKMPQMERPCANLFEVTRQSHDDQRGSLDIEVDTKRIFGWFPCEMKKLVPKFKIFYLVVIAICFNIQ